MFQMWDRFNFFFFFFLNPVYDRWSVQNYLSLSKQLLCLQSIHFSLLPACTKSCFSQVFCCIFCLGPNNIAVSFCIVLVQQDFLFVVLIIWLSQILFSQISHISYVFGPAKRIGSFQSSFYGL